MCPTCGPGPACRTCQALAPATDEQIAQLPAALHADGLTVLLGQDDGGTVAVLRGAHRLEIAVTAESGLQRWETATADDPELLRLLLATARVAGSGDVALHTAPSRMVPVPPDWLVLTYQPGESFQWLVRRDGTRQAGNAPSLADAPHSSGLDPTLRADLADALGVDNVPVPTSAAAARRQPSAAPPVKSRRPRPPRSRSPAASTPTSRSLSPRVDSSAVGPSAPRSTRRWQTGRFPTSSQRGCPTAGTPRPRCSPRPASTAGRR